MPDELNYVDKFSRSEWTRAMAEVRAKRTQFGNEAVGLHQTESSDTIPCEGGWCKRTFGKPRPVVYMTADKKQDLYCRDCAFIWATKVALKCDNVFPD